MNTTKYSFMVYIQPEVKERYQSNKVTGAQ